MNNLLRDLHLHQAWADAEHWRAFEAHPSALADQKMKERLHHIHAVQHAFLWAVWEQSPEFRRTRPTDFQTPAELKEYARAYHRAVIPRVSELGEARLAEAVTIPWFRDPPLRITVQEALTQATMHSHYHRGQNATRLRELGGEPPTTDFILWLRKGRPEAGWG